MISEIIGHVFAAASTTKPQPSSPKGISSYLPKVGWALAVVLFVVLILRDAIRDFLKKLTTSAIDHVAQEFSGSRLLRRRSIKNYRKKIATNLTNIPVPFKLPVQIAMADVYIPLRGATSDSSPIQEADLTQAVTGQRRALVLGIPGSGKSLFLRYLAWSLTSIPDNPNSRIPVIVPLSRLTAPGADIQSEIVAAFGQNGFRHADDFVARELARAESRLLVLFDGLDEVGSAVRAAISGLISAFGDHYPGVRFIITCRTAAYSGSLDGTVEEIFHIQDFSDELVERFLYAWPAIGSRSSVDRLVSALRDTPRVAQLIRNPLLLTMLAYLYSYEYQGSVNMLPHNRTQFYKDATELLLRRWQEQFNEFPWIAKKVVLQHLAVVNQLGGKDRREIGYEEILNEIINVLPRVNIDAARAEDVLMEICLRSGILTSLDNGERFQFAHLTLQEYFAAIELADKPEKIIDAFQNDQSAWREPLKLWCGGDYDSTSVIRSVLASDATLALECLADATRVEEEFATEVVERMKPALEEARPDDPIVRAFGLLAADRRPRGREVFDFIARRAKDPYVGRTFATALVATNLGDAADVIAKLTSQDRSLSPLLEQMGNLAVPGLFRRAEAGEQDAVHSLTVIGTPRAAQTLARLLWNPLHPIATSAAIELAQLTNSSVIEDSLTESLIPAPDRVNSATTALGWAWEPFATNLTADERLTLQLIFGRIIELIYSAEPTDLEVITRPIDERIAIFGFLFNKSGDPYPEINVAAIRRGSAGTEAETMLNSFSRGKVEDLLSDQPSEVSTMTEEMLAILKSQGVSAARCERLRQTKARPLVRLLGAMVDRVSFRPTRKHWLSMLNPKIFRANGSLYHRIPLLLVCAASSASLAYQIYHILHIAGWEMYLNIFDAAAIFAGLCYISSGRWQSRAYYEPLKNFNEAALVCLYSPFCIEEDWFNAVDSYDFTAGAAVMAFTPAWIYGLFETVYQTSGIWSGAIITVVFVAILWAFFYIAAVKQSRSYNPLTEIFDGYEILPRL